MKIREFLTEANWGQADAVLLGRKDCLLTATTVCYPNKGEWFEVRRRIYEQTSPLSPVDWNDAPGRTFAEAKALVERLDV